MKPYLHPRTYRRKFTLLYHRILRGRSREKNISSIERHLTRVFYDSLHDTNRQLYHYVNGVFTKELIVSGIGATVKFKLTENENGLIYHKKSGNSVILIELTVSTKTAALMNRLFDKEFHKMLIIKRELENKEFKELFLK